MRGSIIKKHPLISSSASNQVLAGLSLIMQNQARVFGKRLYHKFGLGLDAVSPHSVNTMYWSECCKSILDNTNAIGAVINMMPFNERCILLFEKDVVYSLVESMLGGSKGFHPLRIEEREFSPFERSLLESITGLAMTTLKKSFLPVVEIKCVLEKLDSKPSASLALLPQDMVTVSDLTVIIIIFDSDLG